MTSKSVTDTPTLESVYSASTPNRKPLSVSKSYPIVTPTKRSSSLSETR